jgi:hypothetical protein
MIDMGSGGTSVRELTDVTGGLADPGKKLLKADHTGDGI